MTKFTPLKNCTEFVHLGGFLIKNSMEIITIKVKNSSDVDKILNLLKKQHFEIEITKKVSKVKSKKGITEAELDKGLLRAMEEGKKTKFVSKSSIMKKLKTNENKIS
jgi:hypothetical protein